MLKENNPTLQNTIENAIDLMVLMGFVLISIETFMVSTCM